MGDDKDDTGEKLINNKLTMKESYKLMQWLDSWRDTIANDKWDVDKAIEELLPKVQPSTGILTEYNVRAAASILEPPIIFCMRTRKKKEKVVGVDRIDDLEDKLREIGEEVISFRGHLILGVKDRMDKLEKKVLDLETTIEKLLATLDLRRIGNSIVSIR